MSSFPVFFSNDLHDFETKLACLASSYVNYMLSCNCALQSECTLFWSSNLFQNCCFHLSA